jgi:tetratricopeptide (TPR) repeat protein
MNKSTGIRFMIAILVVLISWNTFAITHASEDLRLQILKESNIPRRIDLMIRYAMYYASDEDYKDWFQQIHDISSKYKYRPGLIFNRYYQGLVLSDSGKIDLAIDKFKSCINGLDSLGVLQPAEYPLNKIGILFDAAGRQSEKFRYYADKLAYYIRKGPIENTANCLSGEGSYYLYLADYDLAIEHYMRAREIYSAFDSIGFVNQTSLIGNAYLRWGNLGKAEIYLKSALKESIRIGNKVTIIYCYNNLWELFLLKHDFNQALRYCFELREECPNLAPEYRAINLINIAAIHLNRKQTDSAFSYLQEADLLRQHEPVTLVAPYGNLEIDYYYYLYYCLTGDRNQALNHLKTALLEAQSARYFPLILKYTNEIYLYHLNSGDSTMALNYLLQNRSIHDSLISTNMRERIATYELENHERNQETEIKELEVQKASMRKNYLIGFVFLTLISLGAISRFLYKRKRDKEHLMEDFKKQLAKAETKALRAQMNPHFIFNCLNSINWLIIDQKLEFASDYLLKFSKLMRMNLDNSGKDVIPIEKELEALKLYVHLESSRYENKFSCTFNIDKCLDAKTTMIPPMLMQPFVENAIWHGLMHKEDAGSIVIDIKKAGTEFIKISITDDGIGREKAMELKSKSGTPKSFGMELTAQRIEIMNKLNSTGARINVIDLKNSEGHATGTKVELIIPV